MQIIEIVPNYSEGRDKEKMERIVSPFKNKGFDLVRLEMDSSYNRSVLTVIGEKTKVLDAMLESIKITKEEINMNNQSGEHLRIGAVDVCPIIPIRNITEEECIKISEEFAERVNNETSIPVYLYNLSAKQEERKLLPNIRKGEYEGLKEKMSNPLWYPDFGKNMPHPTFGVITIGCRKPLVAYNIDLNTKNRKIAREISKKIRYSSGGYRAVQAREAYLEEKGLMQVSINITDFNLTSIYQVFEAVKMEAKRFDVEVISSEVIGLLFEKSIIDTLKYYLKIEDKKVLELSFDDEVKYLEKYLLLRDFSKEKIVEYYI